MTERCIDASVIVEVVVAEDLSDIAAVLVKETEAGELIIIAPFLLETEVASTLSKKVKDGLIMVDEAQAALTIFQNIPVTFQHFPAIASRALELATKYKWRYAYDGFYEVQNNCFVS